jgi:hypothetical protein
VISADFPPDNKYRLYFKEKVMWAQSQYRHGSGEGKILVRPAVEKLSSAPT